MSPLLVLSPAVFDTYSTRRCRAGQVRRSVRHEPARPTMRGGSASTGGPGSGWTAGRRKKGQYDTMPSTTPPEVTMKPRIIRENVYLIGAVDWDRRVRRAHPPAGRHQLQRLSSPGSEKNALLDSVERTKWPEAPRSSSTAARARISSSTTSSRTTPARRRCSSSASPSSRLQREGKGMLIDHLHVDDARFPWSPTATGLSAIRH